MDKQTFSGSGENHSRRHEQEIWAEYSEYVRMELLSKIYLPGLESRQVPA